MGQKKFHISGSYRVCPQFQASDWKGPIGSGVFKVRKDLLTGLTGKEGIATGRFQQAAFPLLRAQAGHPISNPACLVEVVGHNNDSSIAFEIEEKGFDGIS